MNQIADVEHAHRLATEDDKRYDRLAKALANTYNSPDRTVESLRKHWLGKWNRTGHYDYLRQANLCATEQKRRAAAAA